MTDTATADAAIAMPPMESPPPANLPAEVPKVEHKRSTQVAEADAKVARKPVASKSIGDIAQAIADITREVGIVPKQGVNAFHRYKYAKMEDVLQALSPVMSKHGLIVIQSEVGKSLSDDGGVIAIEYEFTIALGGCKELWPDRPHQTGVSRCRDSKGNYDDKAFNKAHTAARKYFLMALFQIATDDDADAGSNDGPQRAAPRPAPNAALHDPRPEPPPYGPQTGEIMSVEDTARARAREGKTKVIAYWRACVAEDKKKIEAIQHEFPALYPLADN
jgi:hypothetical protein